MQKKNRIMKWGKGLLILSAVAFTGLLAWANWNAPTITEKLAKVEMSSFDLSNVSSQSFDKIQSYLSSRKGITASALNPDSKMASVTFYPGEISKEQLLSGINMVSGSTASYKHFEMKSGCPMRATADFFGKLKQSLCFRD